MIVGKKEKDTAIFLITSMSIDVSKTFDEGCLEASRRFGYFFTFEEAELAVLGNEKDMYEYRYNFVVIEKVWPGVHQRVEEVQWYEWDDGEEIRYDEDELRCGYYRTEKPKCFEGAYHFGIG